MSVITEISRFVEKLDNACSADINECDNNPCNSYEVCSNNIGSYTCTCTRGFTRDRVTDACVGNNKCLSSFICTQNFEKLYQ